MHYYIPPAGWCATDAVFLDVVRTIVALFVVCTVVYPTPWWQNKDFMRQFALGETVVAHQSLVNHATDDDYCGVVWLVFTMPSALSAPSACQARLVPLITPCKYSCKHSTAVAVTLSAAAGHYGSATVCCAQARQPEQASSIQDPVQYIGYDTADSLSNTGSD